MIQLVEDDEAAPAHKRVRFAEKPSHEMPAKDAYSAIDQELARKKLKLGGQRTLLPGEDEEDLEERGFQRSDQGPIKDVDPTTAAKRRAAQRAEQKRQQLKRTGLDVSVIPSDIYGAEEDYDEPEEEYLTDNIPVEPFHLRREREEGFFDAAGNYIQYRTEGEAQDAWLDALDDMDPHQRVEGDLANRLIQAVQAQERGRNKRTSSKNQSGSSSNPQQPGAGPMDSSTEGRKGKQGEQKEGEEEDEEEGEEGEDEDGGDEGEVFVLSHEDVLAYKQRVAGLLMPGENVLTGLRRLGANTSASGDGQPPGSKSRAGRGAEGAAETSLGSTAARQRARKIKRQEQELQEQQQNQQQQNQQQEGEHSQAGPMDASPAGGNNQANGSGGSQDACNSGQAEAKGVGRSVDGSLPGNPCPASGPAMGASPAKPNQKSSAASSPHAAKGTRSGNRAPHNIEFDKLTEYADLLLSAGDFSIYNKSREQLAQEVAQARMPQPTSGSATAAVSQSSGGAVTAATTAAGGAAGIDVRIATFGAAEDGARTAVQLAAALLQSAEAGQAHASSQPVLGMDVANQGANVVTSEGRLDNAGTGDGDDVDMFDQAETLPSADGPALADKPQQQARDQQHQQQASIASAPAAPAVTGPSGPGVVSNASLPSAAIESGVASQPEGITGGTAGGGRGSDGPNAGGVQNGAVGVGATGSQGGVDAGLSQALSGFEQDAASGLHYNSSLGVWYNPATQLFMDANTGGWYRITDDQQYQAVTEAGHGLPAQAQPATG